MKIKLTLTSRNLISTSIDLQASIPFPEAKIKGERQRPPLVTSPMNCLSHDNEDLFKAVKS